MRLPFGSLGAGGVGHDAAAEHIDRVGFVGAFGAFFPGEVDAALVEAHPPVIGFVACEARAVDAGLLACSQSDDLAVEGVADGIRLGEFERDGRDGEVAEGGFRERRGVFGDDDGVEGVVGCYQGVVAVLGEGYAVDCSGFLRGGRVGFVDLEDEVFAAFLFAQDFEGVRLVGWGDYPVADFFADDFGCGDVDFVREGDDVAEGGHAVGASCSCVGLREMG